MLEITQPLEAIALFLLKTGRCWPREGNEFSEIAVNLSAYYILAVFPNVHSNTCEAYLV